MKFLMMFLMLNSAVASASSLWDLDDEIDLLEVVSPEPGVACYVADNMEDVVKECYVKISQCFFDLHSKRRVRFEAKNYFQIDRQGTASFCFDFADELNIARPWDPDVEMIRGRYWRTHGTHLFEPYCRESLRGVGIQHNYSFIQPPMYDLTLPDATSRLSPLSMPLTIIEEDDEEDDEEELPPPPPPSDEEDSVDIEVGVSLDELSLGPFIDALFEI